MMPYKLRNADKREREQSYYDYRHWSVGIIKIHGRCHCGEFQH